jgi:ABC-2 type transport system permease protein
MRPARIAAVARKSLAQLVNDRRTIAFVLVVPLVLIVIFGYGFGGQPTHIATAVANADAGPGGTELLGDLPAGVLDLRAVASASQARADVQEGIVPAAIVIPTAFSQQLVDGNATVTVLVDGTSPTLANAVLAAVQSAIAQAFARAGGHPPVAVVPSYVYGSVDQAFIDTLAPGVMALVAVFATTMLSILVLVREKSQGILERLFSTPLRPGEFVAGHALSLAVIAAAQSVVVLVAAVVIFHATFVGSVVLALGILTLFAVGNVGLGMLISALAQSEFQAVQLIPFLLFPQLFFAGALFPIATIPVAIRPVSTVLPLTYAADALRSVLLRGWGPGDVAVDLGVLVLYAALTLSAATALVRRQS